jgi:cytochrome c oxidase cbb3-type subunit 3
MNFKTCLTIVFLASATTVLAQSKLPPLTRSDEAMAASNYMKYCALCHGEEREGNAADFAPSLSSKSLMQTMPVNIMASTIAFGRPNTAMAAYMDEMGGPLTMKDIFNLSIWLKHQAGFEEIQLDDAVVDGDTEEGLYLYRKHCAKCHGTKGEGKIAPALGNPAFLANASDSYIRYAIANGRENTQMWAFKNKLSDEDMDDLTAYIRSLASGWSPEPRELEPYPEVGSYVISPSGDHPEFELIAGRYVPMEQVLQALKSKKRMVILDTRTASEWHSAHIPGAIPIPYYISKEEVDQGLPKDDTWIVAYCACPHAASDTIIDMLREKGFKNTAVIDEGFFKWINAGYPVTGGKSKK